MSTTQVTIEKDTLNIGITIFFDDLENDIAMKYGSFLRICPCEDNKKHEADSLVFSYLKDVFFINSGSTFLPYQFVKSSCQPESLFIELRAFLPEKANDFYITNRILMSLFAEQRNIIQVSSGEYKKSVLLSSGHETESFFVR